MYVPHTHLCDSNVLIGLFGSQLCSAAPTNRVVSAKPFPLYPRCRRARYDDRAWLPYAGTEIDFLTHPLLGAERRPVSAESSTADTGEGQTVGRKKNHEFSLVVQKYQVNKRYIQQIQRILYEQRVYDASHRISVSAANEQDSYQDTAPASLPGKASRARGETEGPQSPDTQPPTRMMVILQRMQQIRWYWTYAGVISQIDAFFFDPLNARKTNGRIRLGSRSRGGEEARTTSGAGNESIPEAQAWARAGTGAGNYLRCVAQHSRQQDSSVLDIFL